MKPGDKVICPACNAESFLKLKPILDGWTKTGDSLVCGLCSHQFGDYVQPALAETASEPNTKTLAFANLLGGEQVEQPRIAVTEGEQIFCRDCRSFIIHPFMSRCTLHDKQVNPMDDCEDFQPHEK